MEYTTLRVSRDCQRKIKLVASLEGQTMTEWVEWVTDKAYKATMMNRGRKGLTVVK